MKPLIYLLFPVFLFSCKTKTVYVPVETLKTEYKDRLTRDSVYLYDSVFIKQKSDTVFFEKYRILYRDKLIRDSVFMTDSVQVPYPVEVIRKEKYVSGWQNFQIWCGRILLLLLILYLVKKRFF